VHVKSLVAKITAAKRQSRFENKTQQSSVTEVQELSPNRNPAWQGQSDFEVSSLSQSNSNPKTPKLLETILPFDDYPWVSTGFSHAIAAGVHHNLPMPYLFQDPSYPDMEFLGNEDMTETILPMEQILSYHKETQVTDSPVIEQSLTQNSRIQALPTLKTDSPKITSVTMPTISHNLLNNNLLGDNYLVVYYIDDVFSTQLPYYNDKQIATTGLLVSLMIQERSVYFASLALSQLHYHARSQKESWTSTISYSPHKPSYYILALQSLQDLISNSQMGNLTSRAHNSLLSLACIAQLLFYDVSYTYILKPRLS